MSALSTIMTSKVIRNAALSRKGLSFVVDGPAVRLDSSIGVFFFYLGGGGWWGAWRGGGGVYEGTQWCRIRIEAF